MTIYFKKRKSVNYFYFISFQGAIPAKLDGSNIIGILPGKYWSTKKDRPIIIGAHWDTVENSTGFNDNGSGVAILLEVARILGGAKCFQPDYTLFFVAIDSEEAGSYGSQEFLHKIIVPYYIKQGVGIQVSLKLTVKSKIIHSE